MSGNSYVIKGEMHHSLDVLLIYEFPLHLNTKLAQEFGSLLVALHTRFPRAA